MSKIQILAAVLLLVLGVGEWRLHKFESHTSVMVGKYEVVYLSRFGEQKFTPDFEKIINNPAVVEVAWRDGIGTPGVCAWTDWVRPYALGIKFSPRFLHKGTMYKY